MESIKEISKLTLEEMIKNFHLYIALPEGLMQLPVPGKIRIAKKSFIIPKDLTEFTQSICYGQRIFLVQKEDNDFGLIIRIMDGYYYSLYTGKKFDADKALQFGSKVLTCFVEELYPVVTHLAGLIKEMRDNESKLLYREPSKMELAAGIEKLNLFSDLTSLDFLSDVLKVSVPEVLLTPYNECLVRFMKAKAEADFQKNYYELMKEASKPTSKYHAQS